MAGTAPTGRKGRSIFTFESLRANALYDGYLFIPLPCFTSRTFLDELICLSRAANGYRNL